MGFPEFGHIVFRNQTVLRFLGIPQSPFDFLAAHFETRGNLLIFDITDEILYIYKNIIQKILIRQRLRVGTM